MNRFGTQKGFSLIAALFLIIVGAGILLVMSRMIAVEDRESVLALLGNRAYFAARSGMDWAGVEALNGSCTSSQTLTFDGIPVTMTCNATTGIDEGSGTTYDIYSISATAVIGSKSTSTLTRRTLRGLVTNAPSP